MGRKKEENFREAESYCVNMESDASWLYMQTRFQYFRDNFNQSKTLFAAITHPPTQGAAKVLLQTIYERIPFLEMKRTGYDYYVGAP